MQLSLFKKREERGPEEAREGHSWTAESKVLLSAQAPLFLIHNFLCGDLSLGKHKIVLFFRMSQWSRSPDRSAGGMVSSQREDTWVSSC